MEKIKHLLEKAKNSMKQIKLSTLLTKNVLIIVLFVLIIVFTIIQPRFFSGKNFSNILFQNSYMIVAVCGVSIIMISGGTDLSVAFEIALSGVIMAVAMMWWGLPIFVAIILGLITAAILGAFNGILSITLKIHPMMITLATMTIFKGITYLITKSQAIYNLPDSFKFIGQGSFLGIPVAFYITVVIFILTSIFLHKTYFGRHIYAVGSNFQASRLAGINVGRVKVIAFAIGGLLIGVATVLLLARTGSASAGMATGAEFNAITACVLGGISLKGGEGKPWGAVIGVLILGVLANGMQLIGFDLNAQYIAKGVLLIMAIGFDTYQRSLNKIKVKVATQ